MRVRLAALVFVAACGVRTPARMNVDAMIAARGAVEARRELAARVLAEPRDVQARLALAEMAEKTGRPSEAIEQLEAVVRLGGPIGTRWHDEDRARLGRLLLARARVRLARGAATALREFERAASFGAAVSADDLVGARVALAVAKLRHVDAGERAEGRALLAATWRSATTAERGARPGATAAERGAFGAWLWRVGARREAYDQLVAWHGATKPPRDEALQGAYLRAVAWWSPIWLGEVKPPPAEDLVGPERCWFPGTACAPPIVEDVPLPAVRLDADPRVAIAVRYAVTRLDFADISLAHGTGAIDVQPLLPIARAFYRDPAIAERLGRDLVARSTDVALGHATIGALFDALGDPARARAAWQAAVDASAEPSFLRGLAEAAARTGDGPAALVFATKASAAWGDPAVVWTAVAETLVDAGQVVDGLSAARNALDLAGPEVLARALDVAIAASRTLGRAQQADALLVQRAQIAQLPPFAPRGGAGAGADEAEARAALLAHREQPTASTAARLWVASRALPREIEVRAALVDALDADDPRRATVVDELVTLAGDRDPVRAYAAVRALR